MLESTRETKKPIIFIDVDDTMADTRAAIAHLYKSITGDEPLDTRAVKSKRYFEFCPLWDDDQVDKLFRIGNGIYEVVKPLEGAVEGIKYLMNKGYDIRVVTMHSPESIMPKHNWIAKYFPDLKDKVYYVDWHFGNKDVFRGHAIIDDDIKNIKTNDSNYAILLDFYGIYDGVPTKGIKCKSWKEVISRL